MEQINYLKNTLMHFRTTGTLVRSSGFLCKTMLSNIDFNNAQNIVELGPGDGVITRHLLNSMKQDAHLYSFEINEYFLKYLEENFKDPRLSVLPESAEHLIPELASRGVREVDYVVSAVPFMILPESLTESIVGACHQALKPGGKFIQFHYSLNARKYYQKIFKNIRTRFVPFNMPPAFVMVCEKLG